MARETRPIKPETVSRSRIATVVALPLLLLLAALTVGDFFRLRASTFARFVQRLDFEAVQCGDLIGSRLRGLHQSSDFLHDFVRNAASLGDREIEGVLASQMRSQPDILAVGIQFSPAQRPPGLFGPEPPSSLPSCEFASGSTSQAHAYAPIVVRQAGANGLCLANLGEFVDPESTAPSHAFSAASPPEARATLTAVPERLKGIAAFVSPTSVLALQTPTAPATADAALPRITELVNAKSLLAVTPPPGSRAVFAVVADTTGLEAGGMSVLLCTAKEGSPLPTGTRFDITPSTADAGADTASARPPTRITGIGYLAGVSTIPLGPGDSHLQPLRVILLAPVPDVLRTVYRELSDRVFFGVVAITLIVIFATAVGPALLSPLRRLSRSRDHLELNTDPADTDRAPAVGDILRDAQSPLADAASDLAAPARDGAASTDNTIARSIQSALLPTTFPKRPEFDLFAQTAPALRVGGDCYDFFSTGPQTIAVMIADVAGKGFAAAMFMSATRTLIREVAAERARSPAAILTRVNQMLIATSPEMLFVTAFLAVYNIKTGLLTYSSAGHPPPLVLSPDAKTSRRLARATGTVMGAIDDVRYDDREAMLARGERLVLYTDGVSEARAKGSKEFFGEHGLAQLCARHADLRAEFLCHEIIAEIERMEGDARSDDATVLILRRIT